MRVLGRQQIVINLPSGYLQSKSKYRQEGKTVRTMEHSVELGMRNGAVTLLIDSAPQPFTCFKVNENVELWQSLETVRNEMPDIAREGVNLCFIPVFIGWNGPGEYDFSDMDARICNVLDVYDRNTPPSGQKAAIVVRIQAAVFSPDWYVLGNLVDGEYTNKVHFRNFWGSSEPDEIPPGSRFVMRNPRYQEPYAVSPGDRFWDTHALDCLKAIVAHAKSQNYHDRIFGYLPCALSTNEWFLHSDSPDSCCDLSAPMQHAFFEYLREKGIDCSYQPVPTPRETYRKEELVLDPENSADRRVEEFSLFLNRRVAEIIGNFARTIKECYREKNKLVGFFYGYDIELSPVYNLSQSGHIALQRLLECPDIDFLCSPLQYRYRQDIRPFTFSQVHGSLADSMRLYGKMMFAEDDHWPAKGDLFARDEWHDKMYFRRNFASQAAHGHSMWWYANGSDWFSNPERHRWLGELHRAGMRELDMDRSPVAEIAVVMDDRSVSAIRPNPAFWREVLLHTYAGIYPAGAPFELFEQDAFLNRADHRKYKVVIFLNPYRLDKETLARIDALKCASRTLVFMGLAGKVFDSPEGKRSVCAANVRNLAGMEMKIAPHAMPLALWLDPDRTDFLQEKEDLRFGAEESYAGLLSVADPEAETIAFWCDGSTGMARKRFPDWTSVFIGGVRVPDKVWRKLFQDAGIHCYAQCEDVVSVNASLVSYTASSRGEKILTMPKPEILEDVFTGETIRTGKDGSCRFFLRRHETRVFFRK